MGPTPVGFPTYVGHSVSTFQGWAPLQVYAHYLVCKPQPTDQALLGHREAEQFSHGRPAGTWHSKASSPSSLVLELKPWVCGYSVGVCGRCPFQPFLLDLRQHWADTPQICPF